MNYFDLDLEAKYRHICGEQTDISEFLPKLREYASKCKHVTEFGIRTAVSTTALLAAQPDTLISYDIELNLQYLNDLKKNKGRTDFRFFKGDTRFIDIEPTEMLFIDTCHQYQHLKVELERHSSKVSRYLVFHDTWGYRFKDEGDTPTATKGLWPAITEFLSMNRKKWRIELDLQQGWGLSVLAK
jgi:hypothetical protein